MFTRLPGRQCSMVVRFWVSGMTLTVRKSLPQALMVRLMPSSVTEPFSMTSAAKAGGKASVQRREEPACSTERTVATQSTWPLTRCPPRRSPRARARSRLTRSPLRRSPRVVRERLSPEA